jgi:predicted RNA methylase
MDEQGLQIFCEYVSSGVKVFLEYGSGSSTIYAAEHGVENIISIDSDPKWVSMIKEKIINFSCESYIEHCNI